MKYKLPHLKPCSVSRAFRTKASILKIPERADVFPYFSNLVLASTLALLSALLHPCLRAGNVLPSSFLPLLPIRKVSFSVRTSCIPFKGKSLLLHVLMVYLVKLSTFENIHISYVALCNCPAFLQHH